MATRNLSAAYWIFALLYSLLALIFILIIVLSGINDHVVAEYLTIDTKDLNVPAKLGNSELLQDLATLSGQDWVGEGTNAKSLGLSDTYVLNLLVACARDGDKTTCGEPKIGLHFDPSSDLHLDGTSIRGAFSDAYSDQLKTYGEVSMFLAIGYIVGAFFSALSCVLIVLSRCTPRAIIGSQFTSGVAFLILLASAIASVVEFLKLKDTFNDALGDSGVTARTSSKMFGFSFGAVGMALAAFLLVITISRMSRSPRRYGDFDTPSRSLGNDTGGQVPIPAPLGLFRRMTTWNRHKYMEVEKQKPVFHKRSVSHDSDREVLITAAEDDFSHRYPDDLAMEPMKEKFEDTSNRNPNTAYDPHFNTSYEPRVATSYNPYRP